MRKKPKYECDLCGHKEYKKTTWKTVSFAIIKGILMVALMTNFLIGSMCIYNFFQGNIYERPDKLLTLGQMYASVINFQSNFKTQETKESLDNMIAEIGVTNGSEYTKAREIYEYLSRFKYPENESDGIGLNVERTWNERMGDCDQMSYLFISLLKRIDIDGMLDCNYNHCWALIDVDDHQVMADIVQGRWKELK